MCSFHLLTMWSNSRFSQQHHQGLILADRLSMEMSIDTRDQIEILKYCRKFLYFAEILLFLSRNSKHCQKCGKITMKIFSLKSDLQPTANSPLLFATLRHFQAFTRSGFPSCHYPRGKCFLWTLFLFSEGPQVVEPVYNEQWTLGWLRDAPYSSGDGLHTGTRGDLPNETKLTEVKPGFVLTEFPE